MEDTTTGILDWLSPNDCKLRQFANGIVSDAADPAVPAPIMEQFDLRPGQQVTATISHKRPRRRSGKSRGVARAVVESIVEIEGLDPDVWKTRKRFEELTPIDPAPRMTIEYPGCPAACRLIDLFCPIGYGTRGLIVSPPKAGKTVLLQNIAAGIKHNHPDVELVALLIDERPEEVTDFRRNVPAHVLASSNDEDINRHITLGQGVSVANSRVSTQSGKSSMTLRSVLSRRSTNGCTRPRSAAAASESRCRSIGRENRRRKSGGVPRNPGLQNSMIDHNSLSRFSTGVPVSAMRRVAFRAQIARACFVGGFLMYCASSSTTRCQ